MTLALRSSRDGVYFVASTPVLTELGDHVFGRRLGRDRLVDAENLAVLADVERPPPREAPGLQHAVGGRGRLGRIAQQGEVRLFFLGESLVVFDRVDAGHEVGDVELADLVAVLREGLALDRAAARVGLGEPGHDDGLLALEIRQLVGLAVGRRAG